VAPTGASWNAPSNETLRAIAAASGGRAIVDTNAAPAAVRPLFDENSHYYTLGYRRDPNAADGRLRRLRVSLDRPDLQVEPSDRIVHTRVQPVAAATAAPRATASALAGLTPVTDQPLRVAVAPFAQAATSDERRERALVVVALGIQGGNADDALVELETRVFDGEGRRQLSESRRTVRLPAAAGTYDVLSSLGLLPGRYNLRFSVYRPGSRTSGSVYTDVVVPDFAAFSLSGIAVGFEAPRRVAPTDSLAGLPMTPVTQREFQKTDRVSAVIRAYSAAADPVAPIELSSRIVDAHDRERFTSRELLKPVGRTSELTLPLPLDKLDAGDYVLIMEATAPSKNAIRRHVRLAFDEPDPLRRSAPNTYFSTVTVTSTLVTSPVSLSVAATNWAFWPSRRYRLF
jgi:hypothetical protein